MENIRRDMNGKVLEVGQRIEYEGMYYGTVYEHPDGGLIVAWEDGVPDSTLDDGFDYAHIVVDKDAKVPEEEAPNLAECKRMLVFVDGVRMLSFDTEFNIYGEVVEEDYVIASDDGFIVAQIPTDRVQAVIYEREGVKFRWTETCM